MKQFILPTSVVFLILAFTVMALPGCVRKDQNKTYTTEDYKPSLLYTYDGCKVYRAFDPNPAVRTREFYYVNCNK